jgi:hypothetical protein
VANSSEGVDEHEATPVAAHRVDLARALAAGVVAALAASDVCAARVSAGALVDLVNGCAADLLGAEKSDDAPPVVDLEAERRKRSRT